MEYPKIDNEELDPISRKRMKDMYENIKWYLEEQDKAKNKYSADVNAYNIAFLILTQK